MHPGAALISPLSGLLHAAPRMRAVKARSVATEADAFAFAH